MTHDISSVGKSKKAFIGFFWYFISSLFPAVSGVIVFSLASRSIIPGELGTVTLATTITILLAGFCAVGFGDALIQFKKIDNGHINSVFFITISSSILLYILSNLVVFYIDLKPFNELFRIVYPIISIKLIIDSCSIVPLALLTRTMEFKAIGVRTIYCTIGSFIVSIPILYYGGGIWALVFSQLISSLVSAIILWRSSRYRPSFSFNKSKYIDISGFGITTTVSKLVTSINVDNIVIGFVGNATTLGIYAFSRRVFGVISDVINGALANVSYPLYASYQEQFEQLRRVYLKTTFISALVGMPTFLGMILISPDIVPIIFGEQWATAVPALQCCCAIGFISCIGSLQMSLLKGLGRTSWILKYQLCQQIATAFTALFFSHYGATIVMLALVIKTYLIWPSTVFYISSVLKVKIVDYLYNFLKPILASLFMLLSFWLYKNYNLFYFSHWVDIVSSIVICVFVYTVSIFLLARKDIALILNMITKKRHKK